jgi:hypothetical protein
MCDAGGCTKGYPTSRSSGLQQHRCAFQRYFAIVCAPHPFGLADWVGNRKSSLALARNFLVPPRSRQVRTVVAQAVQSPTVKVILQGRKLQVCCWHGRDPMTESSHAHTGYAQVTDAIKAYVVEKVSKACTHFTSAIKQVDVTLSARGGDTGTHGKK